MKRCLVAAVTALLLAGCAGDDCFFHDDWCDASITRPDTAAAFADAPAGPATR